MHIRRPMRGVLALFMVCCAACKREPEPQAVATRATANTKANQDSVDVVDPRYKVDAFAERGALLYGKMCAVCHGQHGEGYRADNAPTLAHQDFLAAASDDYIGYAIADGRPGTTMSAWSASRGGPLSDDDIRALVTLIRGWRRVPRVTLDERSAEGEVSHGKQLFEQKCVRCHSEAGPHVRIRSHELLANVTVGFLRHAVRVGRPPSAMPSFQAELGEQGVEDVVTYLRSLPAWATPDPPPLSLRPPPLPLGPVPLNPEGPEPQQFEVYPNMTSVDVVYKQLDFGARMALLDARTPSDYTAGHIAGAVSVPFYEPEPYLKVLPKDAWLVCYCGCPHAESGVLAERLMKAGFRHVTVLNEGLGVWVERQYPVSVGAEP